jgi:hypothetical protein
MEHPGHIGKNCNAWLKHEPAALSRAALDLALLFDKIPLADTIKRAQAQIGCYKVILDLLQPPPG